MLIYYLGLLIPEKKNKAMQPHTTFHTEKSMKRWYAVKIIRGRKNKSVTQEIAKRIRSASFLAFVANGLGFRFIIPPSYISIPNCFAWSMVLLYILQNCALCMTPFRRTKEGSQYCKWCINSCIATFMISE